MDDRIPHRISSPSKITKAKAMNTYCNLSMIMLQIQRASVIIIVMFDSIASLAGKLRHRFLE